MENCNLVILYCQQALLDSQSLGLAAYAAKRARLVSTGERFLARRDGCRSVECTSAAYLARMREVSEIMSGQGGTPVAAAGRPVLIAFDLCRDRAPALVGARAIAETLHHQPAGGRIQFGIAARSGDRAGRHPAGHSDVEAELERGPRSPP